MAFKFSGSFFFDNSQDPYYTTSTHKHRLCLSFPPQPLGPQTDVLVHNTKRGCFPPHQSSAAAQRVKGVNGGITGNTFFSCYIILQISELIHYILLYMYNTHKHSVHCCYGSQSTVPLFIRAYCLSATALGNLCAFAWEAVFVPRPHWFQSSLSLAWTLSVRQRCHQKQ